MNPVNPDSDKYVHTAIRFYRLCQSCREVSHDLQQQAIANWPAVVVM